MMDANAMHERNFSVDIYLNEMDDSVSSLESEASFEDYRQSPSRRKSCRRNRGETTVPTTPVKTQAAPSPPQRRPSCETFWTDPETAIENLSLPQVVSRIPPGGFRRKHELVDDAHGRKRVSRCRLRRKNGSDITVSLLSKHLPPRETSQGTAETALSSVFSGIAVDEPACQDEGAEQEPRRPRIILPKKPDVLKKPIRQISTGSQ